MVSSRPYFACVLPIPNVLTPLLWYFAQFVSAAVDGAGSQHVDRDTIDRQVPVVHVHPGLDLCHHVGVRAEPHTENVFDSHDAFVRSQRLYQLAAETAVYAASCRSAES